MEDVQLNYSIDALEQSILNECELIEFPVKHTFTPGLYAREIFMPKGSVLTSKVHNTEHPYVVLTGKVSVNIPGVGTEFLEAGYHGVTKPGTRRALYVEEDCKWVTFHPLSEQEELARVDGVSDDDILTMIEDRIIDKLLLPDGESMFEKYQARLADQATEGDALCLGQH